MILSLIIVPVLAALLLSFMRKYAPYIFLGMTVVLAGIVGFVFTKGSALFTGADLHMPGVFMLSIDGLTQLMLALIVLIAFVTAIVALKFTKGYTFYAIAAMAVAGMNALTLVTDIFTLYVFIEVASLSTFALIAFSRDREGLEGGFKYLLLSAVATMFILLGIFLLYAISGGVSFAEISVAVRNPANARMTLLAAACLIAGLSLKSGFVPFHTWVPDAYSSAPNAVSVALAGIITKAVGLYALMRLMFNVLGVTPAMTSIMLIIGIASAVIGAIAAIMENNSKRMLAWSSVSQMGYILLGLFSGTPLGILGGVFHLFNHAVLKSLLFVNVAAIEERTGSRDLSSMGGLGSRMPVTAGTFAVGSLSIAGIPPLGGFWSKLFILIALFSSGNTVLGFIATLVSVLTLWYFLAFQRKAIFGITIDAFKSVREASLTLVIPALLLAAIAVFSGLGFVPVLDIFIRPAAAVIGKGVLW
ncbi:MAG: NADH-quinone oxidoreductase subunit L [Spirochaetes bacterium]|nr:NADH-quinone oxidoreductase subunit L [Spirochaetota bacterium]